MLDGLVRTGGAGDVHGHIVGDYSFLCELKVLEDVRLEDFAHFCEMEV